MTAAKAYRLLNELLWNGRLPKVILKRVADSTMPTCHGLTIQNSLFSTPIILLNSSTKNWEYTLVHEMVHVAEPTLPHGALFNALVGKYYRTAQIQIKDFGTK